MTDATGTPGQIVGTKDGWTYLYDENGNLSRKRTEASDLNGLSTSSRGPLSNEIAQFTQTFRIGQALGGMLAPAQRVAGTKPDKSKGGLSDEDQSIFDAGKKSYQPARSSGGNSSAAPGDYYARTAQIESGNDPSKVSPTGAAGTYQFLPSTWQQYGAGQDIHGDQTQAIQAFTADNNNALSQALGRPPTAGELYLAHQQGADGAIKLLTSPSMTPAQLGLGKVVAVNGGDPNAPASDFTGMWDQKFAGVPSPFAPPSQPQNAQPTQDAGTPAPQQVAQADQQQDADQDQPAFFSGGVVTRAPSMPQRPDRIMPAQRQGIPMLNRGTNPGGGFSARTAMSPGYAAGGFVNNFNQVFNATTGNYGNNNSNNNDTPSPLGQAILDGTGIQGAMDQSNDAVQDFGDDLRDGISQGVQSAASGIGSALGFSRGGAVDAWNKDQQATLPSMLGGGPQPPRAIPAPMPGYDDGGAVDDDTSDDDTSAASPSQNQPAPPQQQFSDPITALASGVGNALHAGLTFLQDTFGLKSGALPGDVNASTGRSAFQSGAGAMSPADADAVVKTVDPDGQHLEDGLANSAGMNALYTHYLQQGDPVKAQKMAASMIQYYAGLSAQYGDRAVKLMQSGDIPGGVAALDKAYDQVPDGRTASAQPNQDGTFTATQQDASGRVIQQQRVTPQDLMKLALGLKNGSGYWSSLADAAAGRFGGPAAQPQPQESQASRGYWNGQAIPAPPASPAPAQPAPAPAPPPVTSAGNQPAPGSPPAAPAEDTVPPDPATALRQWDQQNPQPRLPANIGQASPAEAKAIQADVIARQRAWAQQRTSVVKEAQSNYAGYIKDNQPVPYDLTKPENAQAVTDAATKELADNPLAIEGYGSDKNMTASVGRMFGQLTTGVLSSSNNMSAKDAAGMVNSLVQDPKSTINPQPNKFGEITAKLSTGETFQLPKQALPILAQLRGLQSQAAAKQSKISADKSTAWNNAGTAAGAVGRALYKGVGNTLAPPAY